MSSSVDTEDGQRSTKEGTTLEIRREGENCYKKRKLKKNAELEEDTDDLRKVLSTKQLKLISKLVELQTSFDSFYCDENYKDIPQNITLGKSKEDVDQRIRHIEELLVHDQFLLHQVFLQGMPGTSLFQEEDGTTFLKDRACLNALLMLRWARTYDRRKDAVHILPGRDPYTRTYFKRTYHGDTPDAMFDFFRRVYDLDMSVTECALMQAVLLYTVCPGLSKPEEVRKQYNMLLRTLWDYALQKSPKRVWEMQSILNECRAVAVRLTNPSINPSIRLTKP